MSNKLILNVAMVLAIAGIFAVSERAQTNPKGKSYMLNGTVEQINDFAQTIRIKQEKIAGYSEARIATYNVDNPSILKKLETGDRIVAKIYEKDNTLYDIQVVRIDDRILPVRVLQPPK